MQKKTSKVKPIIKNSIKNKKPNKVLLLFVFFILIINIPALSLLFILLFNPVHWSAKTVMALVVIYLFYDHLKKSKPVFKPTYQVRFLVLALFLNLIGLLSNTYFIFWLGAACSIYSLFVYFYGTKAANKLLPLLFLMQYLGHLNSPTALGLSSLYIRIAATKTAAFLMNILGLETIVKGTYIITSNLSCSIEPSCSGLNNLLSLTFLTILYAYLQKNSLRKISLLGFLAVILAFLSNVFRISILSTIGHFNQVAAILPGTLLHNTIGLAWFLAALFLLVFLERKLVLSPPKKTVRKK